jgi:hypothetical protein
MTTPPNSIFQAAGDGTFSDSEAVNPNVVREFHDLTTGKISNRVSSV